MLKITPYLGILVVIVSIAGLWYPILGYMMPLVILILMVTSVSKGRWFCGNLCPRGSFIDFWIGKVTKNKKIPKSLRSYWIRIPVFAMLMGFMTYRILNTQGLINVAGGFEQVDLKVSGAAFYLFDFTESSQLNV